MITEKDRREFWLCISVVMPVAVALFAVIWVMVP